MQDKASAQGTASAAPSKRITWTAESVGYRVLVGGKRSYCYRYRDGAGAQRCVFLGPGSTEKQAKAKLVEVLGKQGRGEEVRESRERFIDFAERWLSELEKDAGSPHGLASSTVATYRWHFDTWISKSPHLRKPISKVTHNDVAAFIQGMKRHTSEKTGQPLKGWTIRGAVTVLSGIFTEAVDQGVLASNPVQRVSSKKREKVDDETPKRILTADEIDLLLATAKGSGASGGRHSSGCSSSPASDSVKPSDSPGKTLI